jgi:hypothetical protein
MARLAGEHAKARVGRHEQVFDLELDKVPVGLGWLDTPIAS